MADSLETSQHFIFVTQVYFCCMYAVVIWDWVTSLPKEWRFIWKTRWTPVKMSYIFCRYWVILVMPYVLNAYVASHSMAECSKIYRVPVALAMWNQAGAEVVLLIRTYAFFNRNRYILFVLCCGLAGVLAYQLYVDICQMDPLPFVTPPFDKGPCLPMSKPHSAHLLGFFLAPLAFDTTVTSMTLWKAFRIRRRCGAPSSPLIQTFIREGLFYYILISVANLINGIFYLQPRQVMSAINIPLSVMFADVLACRLILDLRERGFEISQPTIHSPGKMNMKVTDIDGNTSSTAIDRGSPTCKYPSSPLPLSYHSTRTTYSTKSKGIKGLIDRASGAATTATIDSCVLSTEGSMQEGREDGVGEISVELQNLPSRSTEMEGKPSDRLGLGIGVPEYHVVDMPLQEVQNAFPLSGIRIDVEKTQM